MGLNHMLKEDYLDLRPKVVSLFEEANILIEKVNMDLLVQQEKFVIQSLVIQAIVSPKILIKDQKTINGKRDISD